MKLLRPAPRSPYADLDFFRGWSNADLALLDQHAEVVDLEPGDVLVPAGAVAREVYVVVQGRVDLVQDRRTVGTVAEGESVGAESLLAGKPSSASAIAETYVRALVLGTRQFHGLLHATPALGRRVAIELAGKLAAVS